MNKQSTDSIIMVKPYHFGYNEQTATSNPYQHTPSELHKNEKSVQTKAMQEFNDMVDKLSKNGIRVLILSKEPHSITPDSIFPNNWFSYHQNNSLVIYPMLAVNRRKERQPEALIQILEKEGFKKPQIIDLTKFEDNGMYLESTGSMVLDRKNNVAFAMQSPRTSKDVFTTWCDAMQYEGVYIESTDHHANEVYHTNLIMSLGTKFAVICSEVIEDKSEREFVLQKLRQLKRVIIEITLKQAYQFCGNILELKTANNKTIIIMSETAKTAFTKIQIATLETYGKILTFSIPTIEKIGGGGVRCMVAEIFSN